MQELSVAIHIRETSTRLWDALFTPSALLSDVVTAISIMLDPLLGSSLIAVSTDC